MTAGRSARALGRLCALLALVAGLAGPLHHMLVRHEVCAEHGELLHVAEPGEGADAGPVALEPERAPPSDEPGYAAGAPAGADAHCVCELVLTQRESLAVAAERFTALPDAPRPASTPLAPVRADERFPRFLLAPKQSPPA